MSLRHQIIFGDARRMSRVQDRSIHLIVTSPPYWQLKDYGSARQIGFDHSYEDYINNLNLVWLECSRVLHDGCRLCVNIGDQFARSTYYGRYKVIPIRTEVIRFCETIGFDFMGSIVWQKVTTCNTSGGATIMGSFPYPRNGIVKIDYEHILLFKKHGKAPKVSTDAKEKSKLTTEEWNEYFSGHWNFPGEKQTDHMAMFPEELPRRLIRMFSFVEETVLDPFAGSGTTTLAASRLERNSVGYEVNREYESIIREKLADIPGVELANDDTSLPDDLINSLPYQFTDPLKLDKSVDPREATFGSKISDDQEPGSELPRVTAILSPSELELDDGRVIALLGVRPLREKTSEAVAFLREKVAGQRVVIRTDDAVDSEKQHPAAYVYLKNKTFINAHLVKRGLAEIDGSLPLTNRTMLKLRDQAAVQS